MLRPMPLWRRLWLLFTLYFCQGLPGGFLAVVLPVVLRRQGFSLGAIGLASALSWPWVAKVLWAPLVDRYGSERFGRRRSWLVPAQIGMLLVTIAFTTTHPEDGLFAIVVLFLVLNVLAATQDIAVDGLAVDLLDEKEMGAGNAAQIGGFKLGNLIGGGVLLALLGTIGWAGDFLIMGLCILGALVLVLFTREPPSERGDRTILEVLRDLWAALRDQGPWLWIFLVYAKFGETFGGAMVKPMLVDHGFTNELIGTVDGIVGSVATIVGAIGAGALSHRRGWWAAVAVFSVIQGAALIGLGFAQEGGIDVETFAVLGAIENLGGGGVGVGVFALAMSRARSEVGASMFTAAQVTYMSGAFLAGPTAGAIAGEVGYLPVMVAGGLMALALAAIAPRVAKLF